MKKLLFVLSIMALENCSPHINPSYAPLAASIDFQGHRGCRGLMPENTIAAFIKALELNVTTLEMDAVITKDGEVIISHEPFFNHEITTKPNGDTITETEEKLLNIYKMNYDEVKKYDVGLKPHPRFPLQQKIHAVKPLLKDVIDAAENYCNTHKRNPVYYNIETKCMPDGDNIYHPEPGQFVEILMKIILEKKIEDRVIIQSFDIRSLQYLHLHYPNIKTALLIEEEDKKIFALQLKALGFIPTIYSPAYQLVTPLLVKQCHDTGIEIIPWTVEDKATMQQLINLGVDGLISDYPNLYAELKK